jgi:hypothetical protein
MERNPCAVVLGTAIAPSRWAEEIGGVFVRWSLLSVGPLGWFLELLLSEMITTGARKEQG